MTRSLVSFKIYPVWLLLALAPSAMAMAQTAPPAVEIPPPAVTQELQMNDGTRLIGRVESIADGKFTFRTTSGLELTLDATSVQSLRAFTGRIVNGEVWENDPNTTRLFFAPTGRSLKRGETYLGVYEIFMPFVQVGVTDRFSIGGGTPLFFASDVDRPFWVTPKFQVLKGERTNASMGVMHFFNVDDGRGAGIAYGVVTHGGVDDAFTIGAGYAYSSDRRQSDLAYPTNPHYEEEDNDGAPLLMIGGEHRTSKRIKVVTENYVFKSGGIASVGVRFFGEKLSADFGLVVPLGGDVFFAFPMINIVRKF
jgi:hypothetical protein